MTTARMFLLKSKENQKTNQKTNVSVASNTQIVGEGQFDYNKSRQKIGGGNIGHQKMGHQKQGTRI